MDFHPRDLPVARTFDIKDERGAAEAVDEMVRMGFQGRDEGFRVLMPKEKNLAKRIGYTVTTGVTKGLRKREVRDVRYWTYHHDADRYGIVLISSASLEKLGF